MEKGREKKLKKLYELQDDLHSVECALSNLEYDYENYEEDLIELLEIKEKRKLWKKGKLYTDDLDEDELEELIETLDSYTHIDMLIEDIKRPMKELKKKINKLKKEEEKLDEKIYKLNAKLYL